MYFLLILSCPGKRVECWPSRPWIAWNRSNYSRWFHLVSLARLGGEHHAVISMYSMSPTSRGPLVSCSLHISNATIWLLQEPFRSGCRNPPPQLSCKCKHMMWTDLEGIWGSKKKKHYVPSCVDGSKHLSSTIVSIVGKSYFQSTQTRILTYWEEYDSHTKCNNVVH